MSEREITSPAELINMVDERVRQDGGASFNSGLNDSVTIGRYYGSRNRRYSAHSSLSATRIRAEDDEEEIIDVTYELHQGTGERVDDFLESVYSYGGLDRDELEGNEALTVQDCTVYEVSSMDGEIEVSRIMKFLIDETPFLEVPVIDGNPIYDAVQVEALKSVSTTTESGLTLVEYSLSGTDSSTPPAASAEFAEMVACFETTTTKLDACVEQMVAILGIVKYGY